MIENGNNVTFIRTIEQHVGGNVYNYDIFKVNNDCVVFELNGKSVFPVVAKKGDFIYLNKIDCTEWNIEQYDVGNKCSTFQTVYDARAEYLVAYKALMVLPNQKPQEVIDAEIIKKGNFKTMKDQIKAWVAVLEVKYGKTLQNINIISFSKY